MAHFPSSAAQEPVCCGCHVIFFYYTEVPCQGISQGLCAAHNGPNDLETIMVLMPGRTSYCLGSPLPCLLYSLRTLSPGDTFQSLLWNAIPRGLHFLLEF